MTTASIYAILISEINRKGVIKMTNFTVFRNFGRYTIKTVGEKHFVYIDNKPAGFFKNYKAAQERIEALKKRYDA